MSTKISHEARRQQILDLLNKHGESTTRDLCRVTGLTRGPILGFLRALRGYGEVTVREEHDGRALVHYYTAVVNTTRVDKAVLRPNNFGLPRREYRGSERDHPHPNQGGQGAIYSHPGVGSCADI